MATLSTLPLVDVLARWRPGSFDPALGRGRTSTTICGSASRPSRAAIDELATDIQRSGIREPVLLGNDGRVWDGHHRIVIAMRLGLAAVPTEEVP